jgi:hypothetical protein
MTDETTKEFSIHQLAEIREAILAVLDDGNGTIDHDWEFYEKGYAIVERFRFVNAIQKRLTARITPDSATVSDTAARAF